MRESPLYDDIGAGHVRADERFHYQFAHPFGQVYGFDDWLYRRVEWYNLTLPDETIGRFTSYILLWFFRWYSGTVKCDGSRTQYCRQKLNDPTLYVMTTTPKEMFSFRIRWRGPFREVWYNMGGI